jgi:hypothetical protein
MTRFFRFLAAVVGLWLLASFGGVMFDPLRANLWTQSLMWALLASVVLAPVFLFVGTSTNTSSSSPSPSEPEQAFDPGDGVDVGERAPQQENEPADRGWPHNS